MSIAPYTDYMSAQLTEAAVARQDRAHWAAPSPRPSFWWRGLDLLQLNLRACVPGPGVGGWPFVYRGRAVYRDADWRADE